MNKYAIFNGKSRKSSLEINEAEFFSLTTANRQLVELWTIEEAAGLAFEAFLELEEDMLIKAMRGRIEERRFLTEDYSLHKWRAEINLKATSFLGATRIYEETVLRCSQHFSQLKKNSDLAKSLFSNAFDQNLEYRVMCALRNLAMHSHPPISRISHGGRNLTSLSIDSNANSSRLRETIDPLISCLELIHPKVRRKTREEIKDLNVEFLNFKFFSRRFCEIVYGIHAEVRKATEHDLEEALTNIRLAEEKFDRYVGARVYLQIGDISCPPEEDTLIDYRHFQYLKELRSRWVGLKNISRTYFSSEVIKSNNTFPSDDQSLWIPH